MASPFVYDEPVTALADRTTELRILLDRALDARNTRLEGPRRYGKTSLLRAALAAAEKAGAIPIEVGFLGCVTAGDVAERIKRAYGAQLDSRLRRWYDGLIRTKPHDQRGAGRRRLPGQTADHRPGTAGSPGPATPHQRTHGQDVPRRLR